MPLPEVVMSDSFGDRARVIRTPRAAVSPTGSNTRSGARLFWGLGLIWIAAAAAVVAGLLHT